MRVKNHTVSLSEIQLNILKVIANLIHEREGEKTIRKENVINSFVISKKTGYTYPTIKKHLKEFKNVVSS